MAVIALVVITLGVGLAVLSGTDPRPVADPGPVATPGAESGDPAVTDVPEPSAGPVRSTSALYRISWPANAVDCPGTPRPAPPVPNPALAGHLREIVDCLVATHRPRVEELGLTLTVPAVATFSTDVRSPCGIVSARAFPAFYCSGNETIYVRYDSDEDPDGYARSAMGYWIVMSHEFGHHLQQRAGVFEEYIDLRAAASGDELAELSRRLELQATCFSGAFLGASGENLGFTAHVEETLSFYRRVAAHDGGAAGHGTPHNATDWFTAGYSSRSLGACVTWDAPAERVA